MADIPKFDVLDKVWQKTHNTPLSAKIERGVLAPDFLLQKSMRAAQAQKYMAEAWKHSSRGFDSESRKMDVSNEGTMEELRQRKLERQQLMINSFYNSMHEGMWEGAKALAEDYKNTYGESGLLRVYKDAYRKHAAPFRTLQQIDPMQRAMLNAGISVQNPNNQTPADRRAYLAYLDANAGKLDLDYHYFLYYMYLQGCYYMAEIQKQLLNYGVKSLSEEDLNSVMRALYENKSAFNWKDSGAVNFKDLYDKAFTKLGSTNRTDKHAGAELGGLNVPVNALKALQDAGIVSGSPSGDYWSVIQLPNHYVVKGKNGEFIDPLRGRYESKRTSTNPDDRAAYEAYGAAGLTENWSR